LDKLLKTLLAIQAAAAAAAAGRPAVLRGGARRRDVGVIRVTRTENFDGNGWAAWHWHGAGDREPQTNCRRGRTADAKGWKMEADTAPTFFCEPWRRRHALLLLPLYFINKRTRSQKSLLLGARQGNRF